MSSQNTARALGGYKSSSSHMAKCPAEIVIGARRYVSAQHVTSMLRISPRTLSRWHAAGTGPPKIKIGKKIFYDLVKISEWLDSRETPSTPVTGRN
jgi:predicted DNA-binding transcriptional regulator AlpA